MLVEMLITTKTHTSRGETPLMYVLDGVLFPFEIFAENFNQEGLFTSFVLAFDIFFLDGLLYIVASHLSNELERIPGEFPKKYENRVMLPSHLSPFLSASRKLLPSVIV